MSNINIHSRVLSITSTEASNTSTFQKNLSNVDYITKRSNCVAIIALLFITTISFISSETHSANLLFKSNFGPGVTLNEPTLSDVPKKNLAWQAITGTDQETGFSWPIAALDSYFSGVQMLTAYPITPTSLGSSASNELMSVTGPHGYPANALIQKVHIKGPVGTWNAQSPLVIKRPWTTDTGDLYISYWFKHPEDLADRLDNTVSAGNALVQFQFKTGGYLDSWKGDYRISTYVVKGKNGKLSWESKGDNVANGPWPRIDYWQVNNAAVKVPVGEWFKYEVFLHRSSGSDGRFWTAVNGQIIVDQRGPNMGDFDLNINRIMVTSNYSGGYSPVEGNMTKLEIWDDFPCGEGLPCNDRCMIN